MNIQQLVAAALVALLVGYVVLLCGLAVRRRRVRLAAVRRALRRRELDQAWLQLRGSAAGAP